jgi:hypothetical protein
MIPNPLSMTPKITLNVMLKMRIEMSVSSELKFRYSDCPKLKYSV